MYFKQQHPYTCSLAVLRMVLSEYGINVTEDELISKVLPVYGSDFKNIWNPTIAKIARSYGIKTKMYALWPLFRKQVTGPALREFRQNPDNMDFLKYENPRDQDRLDASLALSYREMFLALEAGCRGIYGRLTEQRLKSFLSKHQLIQTSVKLHLLYPGQKPVFHSILVYKFRDNQVTYHDPVHGSALTCSVRHLLEATTDVGVAMVYDGLD